jgi:hypothetical protein
VFGCFVQIHDEVTGLLGDPCAGRVRRNAGQHRHLMPQRGDLDLLGTVTTPEQHQQLEEAAENEVERRAEHKQRGSQ